MFLEQLSLRRRLLNQSLSILAFCAAAFTVSLLLIVLVKITADGIDRVSWEFITGKLSSRPKQTGIWSAIVGTTFVIGLTACIAIPIGVSAAVYLDEFSRKDNKFKQFIHLNIANLSSVPSIVYGLLGRALFWHWFMFAGSILTGALTMTTLVLPTIIIVTREALKSVPNSYREASIGLGATKWQTIIFQVLPAASPGILTGIILSLSRAIGETAPLIVVGASATTFYVPNKVTDKYTVLPLQIFNWAQQPEAEFHRASAAAILVLMAGVLLMNSVAIIIRNRQKARLSK